MSPEGAMDSNTGNLRTKKDIQINTRVSSKPYPVEEYSQSSITHDSAISKRYFFSVKLYFSGWSN